MDRRDALKVVAGVAMVATSGLAYDEKLIINKKVMKVVDPQNPTEFELKHSPEIQVGKVDDKGYALVEVTIGQKGIIHPSVDNHWIYEIVLNADGKKVANVILEPTASKGYLATKVKTQGVSVLEAISRCNLHGDYSASVKL
ncbi:MAG: desulfoferrodoxin family protein [Sulfurospirillaceae bacterium]|nr:desulfoferrodoxin family protein [Sulfurospirillaceae bacterium]MDD3462047.1 desulfoferrodoxin family protein [Sulfurospirillaceae bacterium]